MEVLEPADSHPRPQLRRPNWQELSGGWFLLPDHADSASARQWIGGDIGELGSTPITVPYPPESEASGVVDHPAVSTILYRREITDAELFGPGADDRAERVLLHFGAVDYRADIWLDGRHVGEHVGGQTPFSVELTGAIDRDVSTHQLAVRVRDDPADPAQPRGKQTWKGGPEKVWYAQTSGIWQTVWIERVPSTYVTDVWWRTDGTDGVDATIELSERPAGGGRISVALQLDGRSLGWAAVSAAETTVRVRVPVAELANGIDREDILWSPERPILIDASIQLLDATGAVVDHVESYLGIRTVAVAGGRFLLNGRPYYLRGVLNQGYRPLTHLANRGTDELRAEVELAQALGFNLMRMHQKAEDPRMFYWADRLGMLMWAEIGAAYLFSTAAAQALLNEWLDVVKRDRSHPSIVAWIPINESWGFPDLPTSSAQRAFAIGIAGLTRAMDPDRLVMTNEGWEHLDSDIIGVHDYTDDPVALVQRYADRSVVEKSLRTAGPGAGGRVMALTDSQVERFRDGTAALMVSEFGGISVNSTSETFAYSHLYSDSEFRDLLSEIFAALRAGTAICGFCYTQLFDTAQETNGLADAHGKPKLPVDDIRAIVTGR